LKILVADTSPLISLIVINKLSVLTDLYEEVYLPKEVWDELNVHLEIATYREDLLRLSYFVKSVDTPFYNAKIDKGELEAIALYKQLNADFLLIDDKKAREVAEENNINCIGTLAILIKAKHNKLLPLLQPVFQDLLRNKRFYQKELLNSILTFEKEGLL
jgi:uncharacterized protein